MTPKALNGSRSLHRISSLPPVTRIVPAQTTPLRRQPGGRLHRPPIPWRRAPPRPSRPFIPPGGLIGKGAVASGITGFDSSQTQPRGGASKGATASTNPGSESTGTNEVSEARSEPRESMAWGLLDVLYSENCPSSSIESRESETRFQFFTCFVAFSR